MLTYDVYVASSFGGCLLCNSNRQSRLVTWHGMRAVCILWNKVTRSRTRARLIPSDISKLLYAYTVWYVQKRYVQIGMFRIPSIFSQWNAFCRKTRGTQWRDSNSSTVPNFFPAQPLAVSKLATYYLTCDFFMDKHTYLIYPHLFKSHVEYCWTTHNLRGCLFIMVEDWAAGRSLGSTPSNPQPTRATAT